VGTGAGNAEKDTPPQALARSGVGKRARVPAFFGTPSTLLKTPDRLGIPDV